MYCTLVFYSTSNTAKEQLSSASVNITNIVNIVSIVSIINIVRTISIFVTSMFKQLSLCQGLLINLYVQTPRGQKHCLTSRMSTGRHLLKVQKTEVHFQPQAGLSLSPSLL